MLVTDSLRSANNSKLEVRCGTAGRLDGRWHAGAAHVGNLVIKNQVSEIFLCANREVQALFRSFHRMEAVLRVVA